jgi:hypothetical protein
MNGPISWHFVMLSIPLLLAGCTPIAPRTAWDASKAGKKPDSWKCFEGKGAYQSQVGSYCYADGGECERERESFAEKNPSTVSSLGMCGLETKAFCYQAVYAKDVSLQCAKTSEECERHADGKTLQGGGISSVSTCSAM